MAELLPERFDHDAPVLAISVAAGLADMHPQTLRGYDRLGLVVPQRTRGRGRRYSLRDIARLRHVQHLSQDEGINLEGIRRILALESELESAREQVARMAALVQRVQEDPQATRLFTSSPDGVHLGRVRARSPRALIGR